MEELWQVSKKCSFLSTSNKTLTHNEQCLCSVSKALLFFGDLNNNSKIIKGIVLVQELMVLVTGDPTRRHCSKNWSFNHVLKLCHHPAKLLPSQSWLKHCDVKCHSFYFKGSIALSSLYTADSKSPMKTAHGN